MKISKTKKAVITILIVIIGLSITHYMAHVAASSFEAARIAKYLATEFAIIGYIAIVLSLVFLACTFVLALKGPEIITFKEYDHER